jgi:hypothetical protein
VVGMIGGLPWGEEGAGLVGSEAPSYAGFRFPAEIMVSHETIRQWCAKFGQTYANALRRRGPRPGDRRVGSWEPVIFSV